MNRAALVFSVLGFLQRGLLFLLVPILSRSMSVEDFGIVGTLTVGFVLVSSLLGAPLEPAIVRATARETNDPADASRTLTAARRWLLFVCPVVSIALAAVAWGSGGTLLSIPMWLWALELLAGGLSCYSLSFVSPRLRAQRRLRPYATLALLTVATTLVAKVALVAVLPLGAFGWAVGDVATASVSLIAALLLGRHVPRPRSGGGTSLARFSIPLVPHVASNWVIGFVTRPIMAATMSLNAVGLYWMAFNAANVGVMIALEVNRATQVEYSRDTFPGPNEHTAAAVRLQLVSSVALVVATCVTTPFFVGVVLPPAYQEIGPILGILSLMPIMWTLYAIGTNIVIQTAHDARWNWIGSALGATTIIVGSLWMGPTLGPVGVALATVGCYAVMAVTSISTVLILRLRFDWRRVGLGWRSTIASCVAVAAATIPTVLNWSGFWLYALLTLATLAAVFALKGTQRTE